jgi:molybdate transport system substrate-binding protein
VRTKVVSYVAIGAFGCLSLVGCKDGLDGSSDLKSVTISVAASTQDAINEIVQLFEEQTGAKVHVNTASSSALANQIITGAPADLFLSANEKWADAVEQATPVAAQRLLLNNQLVMVVQKDNPHEITSPDDLLGDKVSHLALAGENVPAGIYARQALENMGIKEAIDRSEKIATGHNVRIALNYVERGEAEAGIIYATDAKLTDGVEIVYTFSPETHDPIAYPLLLLVSGDDNPMAGQLYEFLSSAEAAAVFERFGFAVAGDTKQP